MLNKNQKNPEELNNSNNIIGKGTVVSGNIETEGNLRIEGKIIGDIKTKSKVVFGSSSQVEGGIFAQNSEIAGHIKGLVEVTELLVLKSTANIEGDIITNKLVVEVGASFNGKCQMGVKNKEIRIEKLI